MILIKDGGDVRILIILPSVLAEEMSDFQLPVYHNSEVRWQRRKLFHFVQRPKIFLVVCVGALATFTFLFVYPSARSSSRQSYEFSTLEFRKEPRVGIKKGSHALDAGTNESGSREDAFESRVKAEEKEAKDSYSQDKIPKNQEAKVFSGVVDERSSQPKRDVPENEKTRVVTDEDVVESPSEEGMRDSQPDAVQDEKETPPSTGADEKKLAKVREMMEHAWSNYVTYAWGANELDPISKDVNYHTVFGGKPTGASIVDALDTLYMMGMKEEYERASQWVKEKLDFDVFSGSVSLFEVNIRYLGGLLSAYALTKDEAYKEKAIDLADRMLPSFDTPTGIPIGAVKLRKNSGKASWSMGTGVVIAELGTLQLEWMYLSSITGDRKYMDKMRKIRKVITSLQKPQGLIYNAINPGSGGWQSREVSLGGTADSFYEYLIKSYVMTSRNDTEGAELFFNSIKAMEDKGLLQKTSDGFWYFAHLKGAQIIHKMGHLACFSGGAFALASMHLTGERKEHFEELAKEITRTCHESYARTATKIGPEEIVFHPTGTFVQSPMSTYILRPETVESYFYLWRLTHDQKYRDWGWDMVQALEKYSKVNGGYAGLLNVYRDPPGNDHAQQSFFMSETLKYLYLLFSSDSVYPLDKWVFNTEAHPLPVLTSQP
jgi:mannosyl-oligosaccharide alpha-1,2-mannosidase